MPQYLCIHNVGKNTLGRQQVEQISDALQHDPKVHGQRSFMNLSEGKIVCIIESPDQGTLSSWFQKNKVPVDWIGPVEIEGDGGRLRDAARTSQAGVGSGNYPQSNPPA